jgi:hypothetical protein
MDPTPEKQQLSQQLKEAVAAIQDRIQVVQSLPGKIGKIDRGVMLRSREGLLPDSRA